MADFRISFFIALARQLNHLIVHDDQDLVDLVVT